MSNINIHHVNRGVPAGAPRLISGAPTGLVANVVYLGVGVFFGYMTYQYMVDSGVHPAWSGLAAVAAGYAAHIAAQRAAGFLIDTALPPVNPDLNVAA
jgi:hypothetical protein